MVFACPYCPLCRVGSVGLWVHSNEVSLSTMRLGRGWEWAIKKARIDAKEETWSEAERDFGGV
jgi:hypothetical protein